ncbi:MAG: PilZ domain-containing protein [Candidatus Acidiferrales bacterium]
MTPQAGQRRSERVLLDVPVVIRGEGADHRAFQEETFTITVSAHGALVMLATKVALGQKLVLMNPQNWDERDGRVAYVGADRAGLAQVAIEFAQKAAEFWPVHSPPADWQSSR